MASKIKSKKPIHFGKLLIIRSLNVSEETLNFYSENIRRQNPNITPDDLQVEIDKLVRKDNYYNALMDEVARAYEFDLDEDEVNEKMNALSSFDPNIDKDVLKARVEIAIYKKLIYDDLASDWEIIVPDSDVKDTLDNFAKSTGQSIREYLTNSEKFEEVRDTLKEQVISERLMNAFAVEYRLES